MLNSFLLSLHIVRRNWSVYRKDLIANISPTVADPALILVSLGLGLGSYVGSVEGMSYMQYLAPGLCVATSLFTSFFESSYGFYVRMTYENVFKAMLTTPIGVAEVVFGEMLWVGIKGAIMSFGVALVLSVFGLMSNLWNLPLLAVLGFLVALPCGAMGLLSTALVRNINQFQSIYSFIVAPLYFLSGIFFPISQMPTLMRYLVECFPLIHGVRIAQSLFWNKDVLWTLAVFGGVLLLQSFILCWLAYIKIRRKLIA